jgi:hypothetical protein
MPVNISTNNIQETDGANAERVVRSALPVSPPAAKPGNKISEYEARCAAAAAETKKAKGKKTLVLKTTGSNPAKGG